MSKMVKCITTGRVFNSTKEAIEYYNLPKNCKIGMCCNNQRESAGTLEGEPLKWEYVRERVKWDENSFKYKIGDYVNKDIKVIAYKPFQGRKLKKGYAYIKGYYLLCLISNRVFQLRESKLKETSKSPYVTGKLLWEGNWLYKEKHVLPYLKNPEEAKNYTATSVESIDCVCPNCKEKKVMRISNLVKRGFNCINCSDNTPFTELYIICLLKDNNIVYETQKKFDDLGKLSFDFYIPKGNTLIEVQGGYHYSISNRSKLTLEHDIIKRKYCKDKGITLVEIDARKTSLHYVMDSVRASKLNDKLNIDEDRIRELLYRYRLTETDKKVLEVFDTYRQYNQTSRVLGMDSFIVTSTIERYGLEYKLLTNTERPVKCITIDRVFNNIQEAKEWCGLTSNGLEKVLKGRRKYAGKYKGQLLEWEYVD